MLPNCSLIACRRYKTFWILWLALCICNLDLQSFSTSSQQPAYPDLSVFIFREWILISDANDQKLVSPRYQKGNGYPQPRHQHFPLRNLQLSMLRLVPRT